MDDIKVYREGSNWFYLDSGELFGTSKSDDADPYWVETPNGFYTVKLHECGYYYVAVKEI